MEGAKDLTREQIKRRMLNDAADLWGYKRSKIEEFDPLIDLLFGASATEIKRIYDEIRSSESRILERLAELLTPDVQKGHKPAHAVMSARPVDYSYLVEPEELFFYLLKEEKQQKNIFFSPAKPFLVLDAEIVCIAFEQVLKIKKGLDFEKVAQSTHALPGNTYYIGIQRSKELPNLNSFRLFIDWKNEIFEKKQSYIRSLRYTSWRFQGQPIDYDIGFSSILSSNKPTETYQLSDEFDITPQTEKYVLQRYESQFITLHDHTDSTNSTYLPASLKECFSEDDLKQLGESLEWLEITFPKIFPSQAFHQMVVEPNCFPVINRSLHTIPYQALQKVHIVPLESNDFFFAMKEVVNTHDQKYISSPSIDLREGDKKTYTLRQGGTARYDIRDSAAMLDYLFDLLRDESSSFKGLGFDVLASDIKALDKIIHRLERKKKQRIHESKLSEQSLEPLYYLIIRPERSGENIEIKFWGTNGTQANDIPSSTLLQPYQGLNFHRNSIRLVSKSTGGRPRLKTKENLFAFKKALMNRGRVVTAEDIRTECFMLFGGRLNRVAIKHGVSISMQSKKGMERTMDVYLTPSDGQHISSEECEELLAILSTQSTGILPFRVFTTN